jgi:hypothetical protein
MLGLRHELDVLKGIFTSSEKWVEHELQWIEDPANRARAAHVLLDTIDAVEKAAPIAKALADLTPGGPVADILVAGLQKVGMKAEDLIHLEQAAENDPSKWHEFTGAVLDIGGESLRAELAKLIVPGQKALTVFGQVLTTVEQVEAILPHQLQTVIQLAYSAARAGGAIIKQVSGV